MTDLDHKVSLACYEMVLSHLPNKADHDKLQKCRSLDEVRTLVFDKRDRIEAQLMADVNSRKSPFCLFVHVPKTGGSTFRSYLETALGERRFLFEPKQKAQQTLLFRKGLAGDFMDLYSPKMKGFFHSFDIAIGHFQFRHIPKFLLNSNVVISGCMREPLDRALSLYWFIRRTEHPLQSRMLELSIFEAFETLSPFRAMTTNAQLMFLTGTKDYQSATDTLKRYPYLVGKVKHLDLFKKEICSLTGIPAEKGFDGNQNVNPPGYMQEIKKQPGYNKFEAAFLAENASETKLYDELPEIYRSNY